MTKEELERQKWNDIFLEDCAVYDKKIAEEYTTLEEQIAKLKEENKELKEVHESDKRSLALIAKKGADLEREISVLLSCKNCSENKGGYICQKEYEDKCLAQKIQYIKELQEEIAELNGKLSNLSRVAEVRLANWQKYEKENAELKEKVKWYSGQVCFKECAETWGNLTKAIEILKKYHNECPAKYSFEDIDAMAEQFLKECE